MLTSPANSYPLKSHFLFAYWGWQQAANSMDNKFMGCEWKRQIPAAPPPPTLPPLPPSSSQRRLQNIALLLTAASGPLAPPTLSVSGGGGPSSRAGGIGVGSVLPQGGMCDNGSGGGVMTTLLPLIEGKCKCQRRPKGKGLAGFDAAENKL